MPNYPGIYQPSTFTNPASEIDLRLFAIPALNQGSENACFTYAMDEDISLMMARVRVNPAINPNAWYQDALTFEGRPGTDSGINPLSALMIGWANGIPGGEKLSYSMLPSYNLQSSIDSALSEGYAVAVSVVEYAWLPKLSGPIYGAGQDVAALALKYPQFAGMNHASVIVGKTAMVHGGGYILEGTWGTGYGDTGYWFLPYSMTNIVTFAGIVDGYGSYDFRHTPERDMAAELYVALFNRAAEHSGMEYWAHELTGKTTAQVAQAMFNCDPARTLYPAGATAAQVVNAFYTNILGRQADAAGLAYWSAEYTTKGAGATIADIVFAVDAYSGYSEDALISKAMFQNKCAVSEYYGLMLQGEDIGIAQHALVGINANPQEVEVAKIGIAHELGF
jgi:hypothetical protein